jgi:hypothetical protein
MTIVLVKLSGIPCLLFKLIGNTAKSAHRVTKRLASHIRGHGLIEKGSRAAGAPCIWIRGSMGVCLALKAAHSIKKLKKPGAVLEDVGGKSGVFKRAV